jgi:uncharacterized protein YkwD
MPHRLLRPGAFLAGLAVVLVLAFARPAASTSADPQLDSEESTFVTLINNYRAQNGLGPLAIDWELQASADWMSTDLGQKAYFDHTDSLGRDPWIRMCSFGYCYNTWKGENIAGGFTTAQSVFTAWQNSPGHNSNMLGPNYHVMGIARVYTAGSPYTWYWTNDLGGVASNAAGPAAVTATPTPSPAPTPSPTPASNCPNGVVPSWPVSPGDSDCDGFPDTIPALRAPESFIGTNAARACASTSTADDEAGPDAWPPDFNDDQVVNAKDLGKFRPVFNSVAPGPPYSVRFDFNNDRVINGQDTGRFSAYYNKSCA